MTINPRTHEAYDLFHDGILALQRAEETGIRVDVEYLEDQKEKLTDKIDSLEEEFKKTKFFKHWQHTREKDVNIYSNTQLSHFLYNIKKVPIIKETFAGKGSTDDETLKNLKIPELEIILQLRKLKKIRDTYIESFLREQVRGVIHPFFNLHLVRTFRSSSSSPNFQNIPIRDEESMLIVRSALTPRPGHQLLEVDFSGLEVRIAACYHKDPNMLKYLRKNLDLHGEMAEQIFKLDKYDPDQHYVLRQAAKNGFVFPEFYGDYYVNCATNLACTWGQLPQSSWKPGQGVMIGSTSLSDHMISQGIKSFNAFTLHIRSIENDFWGNRFPDYALWKKRWYNIYCKHGYVDMYTGFRCSGVMSRNDSINYPVQGAAFHCNLWSLVEIDKIMREERWDTRIIGQIHDSIIMDVNPSELDHITKITHEITTKRLPETWDWIIVPMDIDMAICPVDASWNEKEKFSLEFAKN